MNRLFGVARRRTGIVDILTPFTYGVDGYRLKWAANFDSGSFTTIITSTNIGYRDANVVYVDAQPLGGFTDNRGRNVRIVFNPTTFSIPDTNSFWLQFVQVIGGVEQTPGAPTLILPDSVHRGVGIVTIHGTAPNGAASVNSLQIDLPGLMEEIRIHNEDGTNFLYVSTESGGPETELKPDTFSQFANIRGTQGSIWVRGGGAPVIFSATMTRAFPR